MTWGLRDEVEHAIVSLHLTAAGWAWLPVKHIELPCC